MTDISRVAGRFLMAALGLGAAFILANLEAPQTPFRNPSFEPLGSMLPSPGTGQSASSPDQ